VRDLDGRIVYWNKGAERTFGWTAEEAVGRVSITLLARDVPLFEAAQAILLATGEWQGELAARTRDGRDITVEVHWTLVRDAAGAPKSILAISTDVSEKKTMEAHFLRAQRMEGIGTLAGGIAHDLNNVLAPILLSVEMLRDMVRNADDLRVLATLNDSAQRGADLVKQVLSFARGVEGVRIPVNPLQLMRDVRTFMRDAFPPTIDVHVTPAEGLWTVTGDPTQLHQVLLNLCVNARDAMTGPGKLTIAMKNVVRDEAYTRTHHDARAGSYVMVTVTDTGTGIPPAVRDRIFEPFFTTKEFGKGTGLGLSTTLAIVRSHGGFIDVESEVGRGTTFTLHLPADPAHVAEALERSRQTNMPRGHGELVLVVDDELAIRTIVGRTLERFGYRVLLAANGAEALERYGEHGDAIAVMLTDMAMPVLDGPATIAVLRNVAPRLRIIGSSGFASRDGGGVAAVDIRHFVAKPYTAEALLQALHLALSEPTDQDPTVPGSSTPSTR
jgi:PAS domain S-box-containing protein